MRRVERQRQSSSTHEVGHVAARGEETSPQRTRGFQVSSVHGSGSFELYPVTRERSQGRTPQKQQQLTREEQDLINRVLRGSAQGSSNDREAQQRHHTPNSLKKENHTNLKFVDPASIGYAVQGGQRYVSPPQTKPRPTPVVYGIDQDEKHPRQRRDSSSSSADEKSSSFTSSSYSSSNNSDDEGGTRSNDNDKHPNYVVRRDHRPLVSVPQQKRDGPRRVIKQVVAVDTRHHPRQRGTVHVLNVLDHAGQLGLRDSDDGESLTDEEDKVVMAIPRNQRLFVRNGVIRSVWRFIKTPQLPVVPPLSNDDGGGQRPDGDGSRGGEDINSKEEQQQRREAGTDAPLPPNATDAAINTSFASVRSRSTAVTPPLQSRDAFVEAKNASRQHHEGSHRHAAGASILNSPTYPNSPPPSLRSPPLKLPPSVPLEDRYELPRSFASAGASLQQSHRVSPSGQSLRSDTAVRVAAQQFLLDDPVRSPPQPAAEQRHSSPRAYPPRTEDSPSRRSAFDNDDSNQQPRLASASRSTMRTPSESLPTFVNPSDSSQRILLSRVTQHKLRDDQGYLSEPMMESESSSPLDTYVVETKTQQQQQPVDLLRAYSQRSLFRPSSSDVDSIRKQAKPLSDGAFLRQPSSSAFSASSYVVGRN